MQSSRKRHSSSDRGPRGLAAARRSALAKTLEPALPAAVRQRPLSSARSSTRAARPPRTPARSAAPVTTATRSRRVRATEVTGIPSTRARSSAWSGWPVDGDAGSGPGPAAGHRHIHEASGARQACREARPRPDGWQARRTQVENGPPGSWPAARSAPWPTAKTPSWTRCSRPCAAGSAPPPARTQARRSCAARDDAMLGCARARPARNRSVHNSHQPGHFHDGTGHGGHVRRERRTGGRAV